MGNGADDSNDGEPKASSGRPSRRLTDRFRPEAAAPLPTSRYAPGTPQVGGDEPLPMPESSRRPGLRRREPVTVPPPASVPPPDSKRPVSRRFNDGGGAPKPPGEPLSIPPPSNRAPPSSRRAGSGTSPDSNRRSQRKLDADGGTIPPPSTGSPPSSRHAGVQPSRSKLPVDAPPPSAPPESQGGLGRVQRLVAWCDAHKGSFFISLLIMQTGIKLREFEATSRDNRLVLAKLWPALDGLLTSAELEELRRAVRDPW